MTRELKRGLRIANDLVTWLNRQHRAYQRARRAGQDRFELSDHPYSKISYMLKRRGSASAIQTLVRLGAVQERYVVDFDLVIRARDGPDSYDAAVLLLAQLNRSGYTDHVKACRWCGLWFVARRAVHDRSCSERCRQAWVRKSPANLTRWRAARADYMRDYRRKRAILKKARERRTQR